MRGKGEQTARPHYHMRITPAYAGKSHGMSSASPMKRDHPRVCGEKGQAPGDYIGYRGSPPRMRGKVCGHPVISVIGGITPAYAGKSAFPESEGNAVRDHPRVCGEKRFITICKKTTWGSPPRMRGKEDFVKLFSLKGGITPAYAGKRLKRSHSIGHFSCILCLFHSVLHRASVSGGSRAGPCAPPCLPAQNAVPV